MSINDSIGTCDTQPWLCVASLVMRLAESGRRGQSSLMKMDGLRESRRMYTILMDGDADTGPAFRENSAELCLALERALSAVPMSVGSYSADGAEQATIAGLLSRLDAFARTGAVVALRVDHGRAPEILQMQVSIGDAYFHAESGELQPLLEEAMMFVERLRTST